MFRRNAIDAVVNITSSSATQYSAGDQVGVVMEVPSAFADSKGSGLLRSINILDIYNQKAKTDIYIFSDLPVNAVADNSAATITAAEMAKCLGMVHFEDTDYVSLGSASAVATKGNINLILRGESDIPSKKTSVWILVVTRGTPTFAAAVALKIRLGIEQY